VSETANVVIAAFMLLFASMYLGTGWSLVLFSFPLAPRLTPETYALPFLEPIRNATRFFTVMTIAMLVAGAALVVGEADSEYLWVPIVYLAGVIGATFVTVSSSSPTTRSQGRCDRPQPPEVSARQVDAPDGGESGPVDGPVGGRRPLLRVEGGLTCPTRRSAGH